MKKICPYCKGEGKAVVVVPHTFIENKFKTAIKWCICMKAKFVSESPENTILSNFEGEIIPFNKIDSRLVFKPDELTESPNLLIRGDYDTFCNHLRSIIIKYRYAEPSNSIYCCESIDVLKRFYVEQSDRINASLSETEKYDLMVLCFGVRQKNDPLKTCMAEVVNLRRRKKKPTWIFMHYQTLELCDQEKSPELEECLKEWPLVVINADGVQINRIPKINNIASNFAGV
jgi:hypothetical protein